MNKYYEISYETVGSRRVEKVMFWANSIRDAINQFTKWENEICGFKFTYNENAILNIRC